MSPKNVCRQCCVLSALLFSSLLITSCGKDGVNPVKSNVSATPDLVVPISNADMSSPENTTVNRQYWASKPINLNGAHDITISGKSIVGGDVPAICLKNCYNVYITENKLTNSTAPGIYLYNCKNIKINYNYIANVSTGVYAQISAVGGIIVNHNQFLNMKGPFPRGQFVQFNAINGINNSISYNKGENVFGKSNPEDAISLYKSHGTAASPIKIVGNWIRGGGPSASGGGIMLGDSGGSYLMASDNILVNPGQYGMAISGGDHNSMTNNTVYGVAQSFTNIGLYVYSIGGNKITGSTVSGNRINFFNASNVSNNAWLAPGEETPAGWNNNSLGVNIGADVLPDVIITY